MPEAIEFLGAERFLFATDYPHDDPGGRMKFEDVRLLRDHKQIAEEAKELIRFKNAQRLFQFAGITHCSRKVNTLSGNS